MMVERVLLVLVLFVIKSYCVFSCCQPPLFEVVEGISIAESINGTNCALSVCILHLSLN